MDEFEFRMTNYGHLMANYPGLNSTIDLGAKQVSLLEFNCPVCSVMNDFGPHSRVKCDCFKFVGKDNSFLFDDRYARDLVGGWLAAQGFQKFEFMAARNLIEWKTGEEAYIPRMWFQKLICFAPDNPVIGSALVSNVVMIGSKPVYDLDWSMKLPGLIESVREMVATNEVVNG